MKLWQYDSLVYGYDIAQVSMVPQNQNIPERNWNQTKKSAIFLALVPSLFFTPSIQSLDWQQYQSQPRLETKKLQYTYPSFFTDNSNFETTKLDKWFPGIQQRYPYQKKWQYLYPSSFYLNTFPAATFIGIPTGQSVNLTFPQSFQYQQTFFVNPTTANEVITADKWYQQSNKPYLDQKRYQYLYPSFFIDAQVLAQSEIITADKFVQPQSQPYPYIKHREFQAPSFFNDAFQSVPLTTEWLQQTNKPYLDVKKFQYLYPSFSIDTLALLQPENVNADKWLPNINQPRQNPKIQPWTYPSFFNDQFATIAGQETITADKWLPLINQPYPYQKRQNWTYPVFFADQFQINLSVEWLQPQSKPYLDLKRLQYTYPTFWIDTKQLTQPEFVSADKWVQPTNKPYRDTLRQQYSYPTLFYYPTPITTVAANLNIIIVDGRVAIQLSGIYYTLL